MNAIKVVKSGLLSAILTFFSLISHAQLSANFSAVPVSGCAPLVVNFTDLSTGNPTQWRWNLGNGTISFLQNPSVTYFNPGQYTIKLVIQNAGGKDSITRFQYINVYALPTVNFTATPLTGCYPLPVHFTDLSSPGNGSIQSWEWDFGDGTSGNTQNPSHTYTASGNYNVSLRIKNSNGCYKTLTRTQYITINSGVHADFSNNIPNSCSPPVNINFQNLSTGTGTLSYQWFFGDGNTSNAQNPSYTYNTPGSFTVRLIVTNTTGCKDTITKPNAIVIGSVNTTFNIPDTVCANFSFTATNTSTPLPSGALWNFGDGTTSTAISPVKSYTTPGTYQIKLVNNFGACKDSLTKDIVVAGKPTSDFSADPRAGCQAPLLVTFTNNSLNAVSYKWSFGDGGTSTLINPTHNYTTPGTYDVRLISTNANGCSDTLKLIQYITIQLPVAHINNMSQQGCAPFSWTFTSSVTTNEPVATYEWDFGDGTTSSQQSPTHVFDSGTYTIQLIITTASGCRDTVKAVNGIRCGVKPIADFIADPRDVCAYLPVTFTDLSLDTVHRWLWDFGDGGHSNLQNPTHVYTDTGYFTVTLVVWNNGCPDTAIFEDYVHINPPIAKFRTNFRCGDGLFRSFTDQSIGADEWNWDFGDGTTSTLQNPTHTFPGPGLYTVTLLVKNYTTGCEFTVSQNIKIVLEQANFVADTSVCRNSAVIFTSAPTTPGNVSSYSWKFGDGGIGTGNPVSHTYTVSGIYTVTLIIKDTLGCKDTLIKPNYIVVSGPTSNFASAIQGSCLQTAVSFIDSSLSDGIHPIVKWIWKYGDGVIDTLTSGPFQHTYSSPGIYTVSLTVIDSKGCSQIKTRANLLTISKPLTHFASVDTSACPGSTVRFTNTSTGPNLNYTWYFGDGGTSILAAPVHSYAANGQYTVKLVIHDQYGCSDSLIKVNYIKVTSPIADFTVSDSVWSCPPLVVNFTNTSQNYSSFTWDFGDGTSGQVVAPSHFYNTPGVYIAKLTIVGPGGCTTVKEHSITLKGPQGSFIYNPFAGCKPLQVNFNATTLDRASFIWDFNDGTTRATTDSIVSHIYTIPGVYVPKMILIDAGGCVVPVTGPDTITVHGVNAAFNFNTPVICDAGTVQFTDSSYGPDIITNYEWNFGDGTTSNLQNPLHLYNTPGTYYPKLKVTIQTGCIDSVISMIPVKVAESPQGLITQSANGCVPVSVTFNGSLAVADTSALNWQWDFGNGNSSVLKNPPAEVYNVAGNYQVKLFVTNSSGCKDTVLSQVDAYAIPVVSAGVDTLICQGRGITLNAAGAANYSWSPPNGLSCSNCANPIATPDSITNYIVSGTTIHGCSNTDSVIVKVKYPFNFTASIGDTLCDGNSLKLSASGAYSYSWSPPAGLNSTTIANPTATPHTTTTYSVTGTDDRNCFSYTKLIPVVVYPIPTVETANDQTINVGKTIDLIPTISADVTSVIWSPTGSIFRNDYPSVTVKPRETTTYLVEVSNPGGCNARANITIHVLCNGANVFIPNTFSPNGDGANDIFYPRGSGLFSIKHAKIFNRWGELVYERNDFKANDASAGWDGTYKGQKLNPDVYVYIIEILCDNNTTLPYKGNITLLK